MHSSLNLFLLAVFGHIAGFPAVGASRSAPVGVLQLLYLRRSLLWFELLPLAGVLHLTMLRERRHSQALNLIFLASSTLSDQEALPTESVRMCLRDNSHFHIYLSVQECVFRLSNSQSFRK